MLPSRERQMEDAIAFLDEAHRGHQRQHDVGGTIRDLEHSTDVLLRPWMLREPGEQIEMHERRQQHVRRVDRIADAIDVDGVGLGETGQIVHRNKSECRAGIRDPGSGISWKLETGSWKLTQLTSVASP